MSKYMSALEAVIPESLIASKGGLSYLSAASAMKLAGRPTATFVDFEGGLPYLACLGGALVAVDLDVDGVSQRMWLPVMDQDNAVIPLAKINANDVNNSRQRCLVKALACFFGHGMSLFLACNGDGPKAVKILGVTPETDLSEVQAITSVLREGGATYVEWGHAIAACRITDADFRWDVVQWNGLPYREVLGGLMVDVDTVYRGRCQRLSLPVMDGAFNAIPKDKVTCFDWNKTVMRCLTKCIAFNAGYGLSVYADEFGTKPAKETPVKQEAPATAPKAKVEAPAEAKVEEAAATTEAKVEAPTEKSAGPVVQPVVAAPTPAAEKKTKTPVEFKATIKTFRDKAKLPGLIDLFGKLAVTDNYSVEDKPICFSMLISAALAQATPDDVVSLLTVITTHDALKYVAQDAKKMVCERLTALTIDHGMQSGQEGLYHAAEMLVQVGAAADMAEVLTLAKNAGATQETLDALVAAL